MGKAIPVRYDPGNIALVYVYINKEWKEAKCGIHAHIDGMSEKQREIVSKKLRELQRLAGEREDASERKFSNFLMSTKGKEAVFEQRKMDNLTTKIHNEHRLLEKSDEASDEGELPQNQTKSLSFLKEPEKLKTYHIEPEA